MRETGTGEAIGHPLVDSRYHHFTGMSADGRYLAIIGDSNDYRVWDSVMGQFFGQPMTGSVSPLRWRSAVSLDGRRLAVADGDTVRIWDTDTGRQVGSPQSGHRVVADVKFSPDGRRLASSGLDNTVRLWDASNGVAVGAPLRGDPNRGVDAFMSIVAFSPDGHSIAGAGSTEGHGALPSAMAPLQLWNADTGAPIGTPVFGNYGDIASVAFSPDGSRIVTGGRDKTVRLWDAHTGQPTGDPLTIQDPVLDVAFTGTQSQIVSVSANSVQIFDADHRGGLGTELRGIQAAQLSTALRDSGLSAWSDNTPEGPRLIVVGNGTLRRLDADSGEDVGQTIVSDALTEVSAFDFSADDRWLAVVGPDNAYTCHRNFEWTSAGRTPQRASRQRQFGGVQPGRADPRHCRRRQNGAVLGLAKRSTNRRADDRSPNSSLVGDLQQRRQSLVFAQHRVDLDLGHHH